MYERIGFPSSSPGAAAIRPANVTRAIGTKRSFRASLECHARADAPSAGNAGAGMLDWTRMKNSFKYKTKEIVEQAIMGSELRDVPGKFSFQDTPTVTWEPDSALGVQECPDLPGLWSFPSFMSKHEASSVVDLTEAVCSGDGERSHTRWRWYDYEESSRKMAPVLPAPQGNKDYDELRDFEVFGGEDPTLWLRIPSLVEEGWPGAAVLHELTSGRMPQLGIPGMERASFLQLQYLQRGSGIHPHIDAAIPKAEVVATIGLEGSAVVRVGNVELFVGEGDLYVITGKARWEVKHEVLPSRADRLSTTIRFNP